MICLVRNLQAAAETKAEEAAYMT